MSDYERTEPEKWEDEVTHFGWYGPIPSAADKHAPVLVLIRFFSQRER